MKIYRFLIITFFIVLSQSKAFSQTGELVVNSYYSDLDSIEVKLYDDDSLIVKFILKSNYDSKEIPIGHYNVVIIINNTYKNHQSFDNIKIEENCRTEIYINLSDIHYESDHNYNYSIFDQVDETVKALSYTSFHVLLGNNFINQNDNFNTYYDFGFNIGGLFSATKYLSFGAQYGSSISNSYFNKSASLSLNPNLDSEKYLYWSFNSTFLTRIKTFNYTRYKIHGPYLDLGINYNLPLMIRYIVKDGYTRTATKRIHNFNDFSAMGRFCYSVFALTVDYRLTHVLKNPYPELPRLKIGLTILIVNNSSQYRGS